MKQKLRPDYVPQPEIKKKEKSLQQRYFNTDKESKQPFPMIPAFLPAAMIMSYFDYADSVQLLLRRLSTRTKMYSISHKGILSNFLTEYVREQ